VSWCPGWGTSKQQQACFLFLRLTPLVGLNFAAFAPPDSAAAAPHSLAMQTSNLAHAPAQQWRALCTPAGTCRLHIAQGRSQTHRDALPRETYSRWVHTPDHKATPVVVGAWLQQTVSNASSYARAYSTASGSSGSCEAAPLNGYRGSYSSCSCVLKLT
jgi:hypothetical protein